MVDTTYVDGTTVIVAEWLNDLNKFFYTTFGGVAGTGGITAATARAALVLGTIATQAANNVAITGGSITRSIS